MHARFKVLIIWLILLLIFSGGCSGASSSRQSQLPAWQNALPVATAASIQPPAIGPQKSAGWLVSWADGGAIYTRTLSTTKELGPAQTIYSGTAPWEPTLIPANNGEWHALWRDLDTYNTPQIFSALISAEGDLLRGPIALSLDGISSFVVASGDGGTAVIIWADLEPRPTLYGQQIDAQGRPSAAPPAVLAHNAEHPGLVRGANGTWYTTWLAWPATALGDPASRTITIATSSRTLPWQSPNVSSIGPYIQPTLTTYVERVAIGLDHTTGYVFVGDRDAADNDNKTYAYTFSLASPAANAQVLEVRLPANLPEESPAIETGFNTGPAWRMTDNEEKISTAWPTPVEGQYQVLPVSFVVDKHIEIGYFEDGQLLGYQPVVENAQPLTRSNLQVDRDRYLTLSWAAFPADQSQPAPQMLMTTHPFIEISQN